MKKIFSFSFAFLGTSSLALASIPFGIGSAKAQEAKTTEGTAADLGVMEVNLKDAVKFNWGFQGALQGAGTPNQAGIGGFIPLHVGNNSVTYVDVLVNANFSDYNGLSSIGTTKVAGTTISTSTRLGYRWLNKNRSWMFGVNAGYDSRPMNTGGTDNGIPITDSQAPFFQQVALNLEAKSDRFSASAYGLVPVGKYGAGTGNVAVLNDSFIADNLSTYGVDFGYKIIPNLKLALGTYYQLDEKEAMESATGVGVKTGLTYDISNELQAGVGYSYDENFQSKITGNLKWRFGGGSKNKKTESLLAANPVIQALSATPENRDVRVANCWVRNRNWDGSLQASFWSWNCRDGWSDFRDSYGNRGIWGMDRSFIDRQRSATGNLIEQARRGQCVGRETAFECRGL
ncbi:carbamoyl-phosphate synthase [Synechococcus sp. UW140]|uniref:carbamoyl-phosphate synthase n=1 Tax=Synechococcus sp. UW140 TaxID=368503 RepID=UPI0025D8699F|nr:carbamoyl-phosphate synthase [Synechococcus sp. UW140]